MRLLLCAFWAAQGALSFPNVQGAAPAGQDIHAVCADKECSTLTLGAGRAEDAVAWASYVDAVETTGWADLRVGFADHAESTAPETAKMYAAGFLEGFLSAEKIGQFHYNRHSQIDDAAGKDNIEDLFEKQRGLIASESNVACLEDGTTEDRCKSGYWRQQVLLLAQLQGVTDGYNKGVEQNGASFMQGAGQRLTLWDLYVINVDGEIPELQQAFSTEAVEERRRLEGMPSFAEMKTKANGKMSHKIRPAKPFGRCSALVRLSGDELFVGHTTWEDYQEMLRVFKYYDFPLKGTGSRLIAFSSYPGAVSSTDDFYTTDANLAVTETTTDVRSSFDRITTDHHVPDFMHIMATTRLASSGKHWVELFADTHFGPGVSGTYNSQWMVVDYNKFASAKPSFLNRALHMQSTVKAPAETLFVLETYPGGVEFHDQSRTLNDHGFWSSFNVPAFTKSRLGLGWPVEAPELVEVSADGGLKSEFKVDGDSYTKAWRSHLFRNLAPRVGDLAGMRDLMQRGNDKESIDGQQRDVPATDFISSRYDIAWDLLAGGTDAKIVSSCLLKEMKIHAISGPTHQGVEPFSWKDHGGPPAGMPEVWNFDWQLMSPFGMAPLTSGGSCK
mmetsp:Transcript_37007/g.80874  ORF Transcript_37007/g.80874 Transcript_37007/m.80874 type:complete len:615 (+) Transcript_37007:42-1886(+)